MEFSVQSGDIGDAGSHSHAIPVELGESRISNRRTVAHVIFDFRVHVSVGEVEREISVEFRDVTLLIVIGELEIISVGVGWRFPQNDTSASESGGTCEGETFKSSIVTELLINIFPGLGCGGDNEKSRSGEIAHIFG